MALQQKYQDQPQHNYKELQDYVNGQSSSKSPTFTYSVPGQTLQTPPANIIYFPHINKNIMENNTLVRHQAFEIPHHVQTNGRKVFSFQPNWSAPPPSNLCELFVKKIPRNMSDYVLIPHFQRFGPLYEFRVMLDFNECNRGYGFIKFCNEEDACRAILVMNHFLIRQGKLLEIHRSYDKCRLFVANIPKDKSKDELELEFRALFPSLERIIMHKRICDHYNNRGFVFLDFPNHAEALIVKKQTTPGRLRKWDRDLKIVWAKEEPDIDPDVMEKVTTLFVRNIDLSVNTSDIYRILTTHVKRSDIRKISRNRELAFIEFVTKEAADTVLSNLNGVQLKGHKLDMHWATPQNLTVQDVMKHKNFDEMLRLKCIANYWSIPIFIYGRIFHQISVQYIAVIIRAKNIPHVFFVEMDLTDIKDIHRKTCEVIVTVIDYCGQLPLQHFIIKVKKNSALLIGCVTDLSTVNYRKAINISENSLIHSNELSELSRICYLLCQYSENQIILIYTSSFKQPGVPIFNAPNVKTRERILGCILPSTKILKYRLNNTQLIFSLIHIATLSNYLFPINSSPERLINFIDIEEDDNRMTQWQMIIIQLMPLDVLEDGSNFKTVSFSPNERYICSPVWIDGCSYSEKIYDI